MTDALAQLAAVLVEKFGVDAQEIAPEVTFDDLGLDSLAAVEVADVLQEVLGFPVDDAAFSRRISLREIADLLGRQPEAAS